MNAHLIATLDLRHLDAAAINAALANRDEEEFVTDARYDHTDERGGLVYEVKHENDSPLSFVAVYLSADRGKIVAEWVA